MRTKIGIIGALFALVVLCVVGFGTTQAGISFEHSRYTVQAGRSVDVDITMDYTELNTTGDIFDSLKGTIYDGENLNATDLTEDDIDYVTDFDRDTFITITNGSQRLIGEGYYWFTLEKGEEITNFDGAWMKKSSGVDAYVMVCNNSIGLDSLAMIMEDDNNPVYFTEMSNESYHLAGGILPMDMYYDYMSVEAYVAEFGAIDNITVIFDSAGPFNKGAAPMDLPDFDREMNWYEFHLFNVEPVVSNVAIIDEEGYTQAWGITTTDTGDASWRINLDVPGTAPAGNYFLVVYDGEQANDSTVISVVVPTNNIWVWAYPVVSFLVGIGLIGAADILADTKTNKVTVVLLVAIGAIMFFIGAVMVTDILGYTAIGIMPAALVALGGAAKRDELAASCRRHRSKIRAALALGLVFGLAFIGAASCVKAAASDYAITPDSETAQAGDRLTFTVTSENADLDEDNITVNIQKVDESSPFNVHWTYTVTVNDDADAATIRVTVPEGADAGTYTITVTQTTEQFTLYATVYITSEAGLNWMIFGFFLLTGLSFVAIWALGWKYVKKTKSKFDDAGLVMVCVAGVCFIALAIAYYFGYFSI